MKRKCLRNLTTRCQNISYKQKGTSNDKQKVNIKTMISIELLYKKIRTKTFHI